MTDGREERQAEFLRKAREAEAQAARINDVVLQESWKRIAESYRALARTQAVLNKRYLTKWRPNFAQPEETATPG